MLVELATWAMSGESAGVGDQIAPRATAAAAVIGNGKGPNR